MSLPSSFDAPAPESLAALLPAYDIEMLIASGDTGAVYKARQKSLDRDVAIKILPPERMADPKARQAFEAGARVLAKLNHPNLISIFDCGSLGEMPFIVMEFVPGKSLERSAKGQKIDPAQAAELVIAICKGLAHAHDNGVIHRDLKLANILLNQKAEPKIGDFGLADLREAGTGHAYIAPEVLRQPEVADRRSDIFSVGVILYTLLAGKEPVPGCPPPSAVCSVDAMLDHIWQRATNPNPGFRYPDCHELGADLSAWLKAKLAGRVAAAAAAGAPPSPATTGSLPRAGAPPMRALPKRLDEEAPVVVKGGSGGMLVNLILLAILGGGGYFAWQKFSGPSTTTPPARETSGGLSEDGGSSGTPGAASSLVPRGGGAPRPDESSPFGKPIPGSGTGKDTAATDPHPENAPADALTPKARELIAAAEKDRTKALTENVRNFTGELDSWVRGLPRKEQASSQNQVDRLKGYVRDFRVPEAVPSIDGRSIVPEMSRAVAKAAAKQKQIDAEYATKVGRFRDLYVAKMRTSIEEATKNGQSTGQLSARLAAATELSVWIESLGGKLQPANPVVQEDNEYRGFFDPSPNPFGTPVK